MYYDSFGEFQMDLRKVILANNFLILILSYCTKQVYGQTDCVDKNHEGLLNLMFYGNLILYLSILIVTFLNSLNILEPLIEKIGCSPVLVYLSVKGFVLIAVLFDLVCIFFAVDVYYFQPISQCKELQLFTMICAYIFTVCLGVLVFNLVEYFSNRVRGEDMDYESMGQLRKDTQNTN